MRKVLIIQNDAKEGAGQLGTLLDDRGYTCVSMLGWKADYSTLLPSDYSALVLLGGAQSAYDAHTYPFLADEIRLAQSFINESKPVIGLCLGAQIVAIALGGAVKPNSVKELGWHDITLTDDGGSDSLMSKHSESAPAFHFHGDYFDTPPDCTCLAGSNVTPCQVFRYKDNVYGFQYHVEVDESLLEVMCLNNTDYMAANGSDAQAVVDQSASMIDGYKQRSAGVLNAWIDMLEVKT